MSEIAKAGRLLCVNSGSYSDYYVTGFFMVLKDFDPVAELAEFLAAHPKQTKDYHFKSDQWLATMLAKGLLLEIQHGQLHMEDYRCAREMRFTP